MKLNTMENMKWAVENLIGDHISCKKDLQELVERATPKKILESDEYIGVCPSCDWNLEWANNIRRDYEFCPRCGQALKWSDEE